MRKIAKTLISSVILLPQIAFSMVYNPNSLWDQNQELKVLFLEGKQKDIKRVKEVAAQWNQFMNLKLSFYDIGTLSVEEADIKVSLDRNTCDWKNQSIVGRASKTYNHGPSLCLGSLKKDSTILHEFGHALGLKHEHLHPGSYDLLDGDIIDLCMRKNAAKEWTREKCEQNYASDPSSIFAEYDKNSVMHYSFDEWMYKSKEDYLPGTLPILSLGDRIGINELYPTGQSQEEIKENYERELLKVSYKGCVVKNIIEAEYLNQLPKDKTCEEGKPFFITRPYTNEQGNTSWSSFTLTCDTTREYAVRKMLSSDHCNL